MSKWQYLQTTLKLAFNQTLQTLGHTRAAVIFAVALYGLRLLLKWRAEGWTAASDEILGLILSSLDLPALLIVLIFLWHFLWKVPYTLYAQLSDKLESDISISQIRGHGTNLVSTYISPDSWFVLVRDLLIVNRSERDEVVSLDLWWPLQNGGSLTVSPQTTPPPELAAVSLLTGAENVPARKSVMGNFLFKLPKSTVPQISALLLILLVKSQLTGIERAFNSLDFAEVKKPYPCNIEELNQQRASS
jgi:hypothetical protein